MRGISELLEVVFLALGLTVIAVLGFYFASRQYEMYEQDAAIREGVLFTSTLYDLLSTRTGAGYTIKMPFSLIDGFITYTYEPVSLNLTIKVGSLTYNLNPNVLGGASPIIFYSLGDVGTPTLKDAVTYVSKGTLDVPSGDLLNTINLFKYGAGTNYVAGLAWLPAYSANIEMIGTIKRLVVVVRIPDAERATFSKGSAGVTRVTTRIVGSVRLDAFSYSFNSPQAVTLTLQCWSPSLPVYQVTQTFFDISDVRVTVLKEEVTVDFLG